MPIYRYGTFKAPAYHAFVFMLARGRQVQSQRERGRSSSRPRSRSRGYRGKGPGHVSISFGPSRSSRPPEAMARAKARARARACKTACAVLVVFLRQVRSSASPTSRAGAAEVTHAAGSAARASCARIRGARGGASAQVATGTPRMIWPEPRSAHWSKLPETLAQGFHLRDAAAKAVQIWCGLQAAGLCGPRLGALCLDPRVVVRCVQAPR